MPPRLIEFLPSLGARAGKRPHPLLVLGEFGGGTPVDDGAVVENVGTVGDLDRRAP
jgi:hypothetical protein